MGEAEDLAEDAAYSFGLVEIRQVAQTLRDGLISVVETPPPTLRTGWVLVANRYSLISAGTERTKIVIGQKSVLQKARARPDLVKKLVDRARVEGISAAVGVARDRLAALAPIGYSSAGVVLELGTGVEGLAPGDRVACGGGGWANHAEVIAVPRRLAVSVPESVALDDAAYATIGAIALHGVRQCDAGIGEWVAVIGLGLVGQLAVRVLSAAGCHVVGIDLDTPAVELARSAGALAFERGDPGLESGVRSATRGLGVDAILLCASSESPDPLELAVRLARDRGRVIVLGATRIDIDRTLMYEKELELRMSRSYGPGRYDRDYEERGRELPAEYVRWTEQRNMLAFLDLIATGRVTPGDLTTHRFPVEDATDAYAALNGVDEQRAFGVLLEYPTSVTEVPQKRLRSAGTSAKAPGIAVVGAGAYARATLIPAFKNAGASLVAVASASGLTAEDVAARFAFERAAGSVEEVLHDDSIGAVVIATRHSSHALLTAAALRAGKAVFVEKPLALSFEELDEVTDALSADSLLMVGFNRRFAPLVERLQSEIDDHSDLVLAMRVNAGPLPDNHWLNDPEEGGGRLLGEGCHFVDLLSTVARRRALSGIAVAVPQPGRSVECSDSFTAQIRFVGAVASLLYSGSGDTRLPKERLEVLGGGMAAVLEDFRRLDIYRRGKRARWKSAQDKGHRAEITRFLASARGEVEAPSVESYLDATRLTLALAASLRTGQPVELAR
jgi:predicted dehydrogenase/threonine dehydrogenase-like Zn-dependent dehydrogenase